MSRSCTLLRFVVNHVGAMPHVEPFIQGLGLSELMHEVGTPSCRLAMGHLRDVRKGMLSSIRKPDQSVHSAVVSISSQSSRKYPNVSIVSPMPDGRSSIFCAPLSDNLDGFVSRSSRSRAMAVDIDAPIVLLRKRPYEGPSKSAAVGSSSSSLVQQANKQFLRKTRQGRVLKGESIDMA